MGKKAKHPISKRDFVEVMEYKTDRPEPEMNSPISSSEMKTIKLKSFNDLPAHYTGIVEWENGKKEWYKEGLLHREDGPAVEYVDGSKEWYKEGLHHRIDGPAIEKVNGVKFWYVEGLLHRENGPAVEHVDGSKQWWIEDEYYTEEEFKEEIERRNLEKQPKPQEENMTKTLKLKSWELIPVKFTGIVEFYNGSKAWYKEGKFHRKDGPAIEKVNGVKFWYVEGLLHRENGPAVEHVDGSKQWYKEGKFHRKDGPAIEYADGTKKWCIEGNCHREDGPAIEFQNGDKQWWIEGMKYSEENFKKEIERRNQKNINSETNIKTEIAAPLTASAASLKSEGTPASEEKKMTKSTKEKVFEIAKSDAVEVAKRVAVQQISSAIQTLLIELISSGKKGKQKTALKSNLEEFFSSEAGRAMVKFASGLMLPQLAAYAEKYGMLKPQHVMIVQVLSEEMRIQGETDATLHVIDMVTPMLSMLTSGMTSQFGSLFSSFEETVEPVRVALDSGVESNSTHEETIGSSAVALKTAVG